MHQIWHLAFNNCSRIVGYLIDFVFLKKFAQVRQFALAHMKCVAIVLPSMRGSRFLMSVAIERPRGPAS
jgi:hypothetical protein